MKNEHAIAKEVLPARLPVLGHIKIGAKKPARTSGKGNAFQPPTKLDHFLVTLRERGQDGNYLRDDAVHEVVGDKPRELDVRLPFDTRGENFYAKMVQYRGRTRALECDGRTCLNLSTQVKTTCARLAGRSCECKPYARLGVILEAAPTVGGLYVFRTTSWESANSLQTGLMMFEEQFGTLRGLPLSLRLYPAEVRFKVGNEERTGTAYKVALVLRADYETAQSAALEFHRRTQIARKELLQLSRGAGETLDELDAAEEGAIDDEFFGRRGADSDTDDTPAPEPSGAERLARVNEAILGGPGSGPEEDAAAPDAVGVYVTELEQLMNQANASGVTLTDKQRGMLEAAISGRNEENLRASIGWLADRITGNTRGQE